MAAQIVYKGHLVVFENAGGYVISKDNKVIFSTGQTFPSLDEAEVHAKLVINRLEVRNDGWIVS